MKDAASQYQAVLLATHRSHPSIFCLPSTLFYEGNVNVSKFLFCGVNSLLHMGIGSGELLSTIGTTGIQNINESIRFHGTQ